MRSSAALLWRAAVAGASMFCMAANAQLIGIDRVYSDENTLLFNLSGLDPDIPYDTSGSDAYQGRDVSFALTARFGTIINVEYGYGPEVAFDTIRMRIHGGNYEVSPGDATADYWDLGNGRWRFLYGEDPIPESSTWVTGVMLGGLAMSFLARRRQSKTQERSGSISGFYSTDLIGMPKEHGLPCGHYQFRRSARWWPDCQESSLDPIGARRAKEGGMFDPHFRHRRSPRDRWEAGTPSRQRSCRRQAGSAALR